MELNINRRQCLVILGTLISFSLRLGECIKLDGYKFAVYSTDFCPRNETEWKERSTVLNCTEKNGYTCLPDEHFTELLEFCYTDPWILIEEGLCLYLIKNNSLVHGYKCNNFQFGCPTSSYISTEIYEHPSCTLIRNGCFNADQICKSSTTKYEKSDDEKNESVLAATLSGVFSTICICIIIIMLYGYFRKSKKFPYCKRNIDEETNEPEEIMQFIPEQPKSMKSEEEMISKNNLETTLDDTRLTFVRIKNLSSTEEQQERFQQTKSKSTKVAVAAIDFGSSYSGCAFSFQYEWSKVKVNAPKNFDYFMSRKTPTTLLLNPDQSFCAFGYEAENKFSKMAEIENNSESDDEVKNVKKEKCSDYHYFQKLTMILHEKDKLHRDFMIKDLSGKPMRAMKIFSIFIKYLTDSLLEAMNKGLDHNGISKSDIDFVLVVPARCGDGAKVFMREAAIKAGINQPTLAFEEEAALIYCQHMHLENHQLYLTKRNEYVVVDIGGISVDIAVHKQNENGTLKEMILAWGQCGEISVDEDFEKFMDTIGGKGIMKLFAKYNMKEYLTLLRNFEAKRFEESRPIVRMNVPLSLDALIQEKYGCGIKKSLQSTMYRDRVTYEQNKLCIPRSVFKTFFQNTINNVSKFIEEILAKTDAKDVIITGRFADCKLVKDSLLERFKTYRIVIPPEAGLAVLKGAVYFGHIPNTKSMRFTRFTYGVGINELYGSEYDHEKQIDVEKLPISKNSFYPLVRQGEQIETGVEYHMFHSLKARPNKVECELYVSGQENHTDKKGCKLLGKLLVPLPCDENDFKIKGGIVFDEMEIIFRVGLDSGPFFERSFDILDEKNLPYS